MSHSYEYQEAEDLSRRLRKSKFGRSYWSDDAQYTLRGLRRVLPHDPELRQAVIEFITRGEPVDPPTPIDVTTVGGGRVIVNVYGKDVEVKRHET